MMRASAEPIIVFSNHGDPLQPPQLVNRNHPLSLCNCEAQDTLQIGLMDAKPLTEPSCISSVS